LTGGHSSPGRLSQHDRPTRAHHAVLIAAWAGWLFDFYDLLLYAFLLGPIGAELGFGRSEHAWVLGISLGSTALGGLLFGSLADRFGRRPVLQATILTYSAGAFLSGWAVNLPTLAAARIITGLGVGASRFGARAALDLADGVDSELTRLRLVRTKPLPFPPEPIRWAGITLTRKELARADRTGKRGLWLSALDRVGLGFDS